MMIILHNMLQFQGEYVQLEIEDIDVTDNG